MSDSPTYTKIALAYRWCIDVTPERGEELRAHWLQYLEGQNVDRTVTLTDLYGDLATVDFAQIVFFGTTSREGRRQCNRLSAIEVQEQEDDTPADWERHL